MSAKDLTQSEADALINTRLAKSKLLVPPWGAQPFHTLLVNWLNHLDAATFGDYLVKKDDTGNTYIYVAPGRFQLRGVVLAYAGGSIDLTAYNNDTAYVWLENSGGGVAAINKAADGTGWPATAHIKLAEVTLASGAITTIVDRRIDQIGTDGTELLGVVSASFTVLLGGSTAKLALDTNSATGNYTLKLVPANLTANCTWTFPDGGGTVASRSYVDAAIFGLDWNESVLDRDLATPPGSPTDGARYIIATSGTGAWSGHDGKIAEWSATAAAWTITTPNEGFSLRVEDENLQLVHNGSAWVGLGTGISLDDVLNGSTYKKLAGVDGSNQATASSLASNAVETAKLNAGSVTVAKLEDIIQDAMATYTFAITVQGTTGSPSTVTITLKDLAGNAIAAANFLRVRVCDSGAYANATNATIAAGTNTTAVETHTATKDLTLQSHTDGIFTITLTDGSAETVTLRIGPAFSARRADFSTTQNVTHA